jgi:hypothetical protein
MRTSALVWIVIGIVVLIALAVWAYGFFSTPAPQSMQQSEQVTVAGKIVCLPHRNQSGPQTLECAYGLEGDDGQYYGLTDIAAPTAEAVTTFPTNTHVVVRGMLTLADDQRYATIGTIEIDSIISTDTNGNTTASTTGETISNGVFTFARPEDLALAVSKEQVATSSYIPPCDDGFDYCLYYNGTAYENTNLDSAGLTIMKRADLHTQSACLDTQPEGYSDLTESTSSSASAPMSLFAPVGDAGAGHYATGEEYRLYASSTCYQFTTRVAESQFANYPAGTITEFTKSERESLLDTLRGIIGDIRLDATGAKLQLPPRPQSAS